MTDIEVRSLFVIIRYYSLKNKTPMLICGIFQKYTDS